MGSFVLEQRSPRPTCSERVEKISQRNNSLIRIFREMTPWTLRDSTQIGADRDLGPSAGELRRETAESCGQPYGGVGELV